MKTINKKIVSISLALMQISVNPVWAQYGRGSQDARCLKEIAYEYYEIKKPKIIAKIGEQAIISMPAIMKDGTIVIGSDDHNVYFLNPNGKLKTKFETDDIVRSSPAIMNDGTVVVGSWDGFVYFLSPNGKLKAKFETGNMIFSSPAIMNDGTVIIGANNVVYFLNPNGTLKAKFDKNEGITSSPAIMSDGTVVVGSNDGNVYYLDLDPSRIEKKQEKRIIEVPGSCSN